MKKILQFIALFAIILMSVNSFGQDFVRTNMANSSEVLNLNPKQVLEVNLPSTPSSGYSWYVKDASRLTLLQQVGHESFVSDDPENSIGASGTTTIRFIPSGKGSCELEMEYKRVFENEAAMANYKVKVNCEGSYTGNYIPQEPATVIEEASTTRAVPASWTWQPKCTSVKNQGSCGSCWAFATTAAFEASIYIWDRVVKDFSEQFLVNCHTSSNGCGGGTSSAYSLYVNKGAVAESALPYKAKNGTCATYTHQEKAISYKNVSNSQTSLKQAIYDYGPIYTAICAGSNLNNVGTGILTKSDGTSLNHAVLLVGWDDAGGYWIVKNSWGTSFGNKGYFRIKYGVSGIGGASALINYKGVIQHGPTGIAAHAADTKLNVSPNPSNGVFTFAGLEEINKVEVYDVVGRIVHESVSKDSKHIIDLSNQTKGMYIYKIINTQTNKVAQGRLMVNN